MKKTIFVKLKKANRNEDQIKIKTLRYLKITVTIVAFRIRLSFLYPLMDMNIVLEGLV